MADYLRNALQISDTVFPTAELALATSHSQNGVHEESDRMPTGACAHSRFLRMIGGLGASVVTDGQIYRRADAQNPRLAENRAR
jgi:hypothetical protein